MLPAGVKPITRDKIMDIIPTIYIWGQPPYDENYRYGVEDVGNAIFDTTDFNSVESVKESINMLDALERQYNDIMVKNTFMRAVDQAAAEKVGGRLARAIQGMAAHLVPEKVIVYPEHVCNQARMKRHY